MAKKIAITPTVADFFCGAGGFTEGFNQSGFNVIFGLDSWKPAVETHDFNHPGCKSTHMNILHLDTEEKIDEVVPDTDIIVGSPPCISFSNSNNSGKADKTLGIKLIEQFLKIILYKKTKPNSKLKYWIMENVPNSLKSVKDVYTAKELGLDESLPDLIVETKNILVASDYGTSQGRKRAICGDYIVPKKTHSDNNVYIESIMKELGPPVNNNKKEIQDPSFSNIKLTKEELSDHFYDSEVPKEWWKKAKRLKTDHGYMGKMDFPDRTNRLCRTIMATESYCSRESIIFPKEETELFRAPTIRELGCCMGFPIDYQFIGNSSTTKHKLIGNAVCVQLSKALADEIKKEMKIKLTVKKRQVKSIPFNLNTIKAPLFSKFKPKPRKINSKYHIHVPNLKIKQLRVELDNMESEFENEQFKWSCYLHKGSGKNAVKSKISNSQIVQYIENHKDYTKMMEVISNQLNPFLFNSKIFQEKNCNIVVDSNHISPNDALSIVSEFITSVDDTNIDCPLLDSILKYKKSTQHPIKIIMALYMVNKISEYVSNN